MGCFSTGYGLDGAILAVFFVIQRIDTAIPCGHPFCYRCHVVCYKWDKHVLPAPVVKSTPVDLGDPLITPFSTVLGWEYANDCSKRTHWIDNKPGGNCCCFTLKKVKDSDDAEAIKKANDAVMNAAQKVGEEMYKAQAEAQQQKPARLRSC